MHRNVSKPGHGSLQHQQRLAEPALTSTSTGLSLGCGECGQMGPVPLTCPLGSVGSKHQLVEMLCPILNI